MIVSFAVFADNLWYDIATQKIFTEGLVRYWGIPEIVMEHETMFFTVNTAHEMCGVGRRAFQYWIFKDKIHGERDTPAGRWLFSLYEINRVRKERGMKQLTRIEAKEIWEERVRDKKHGVKT